MRKRLRTMPFCAPQRLRAVFPAVQGKEIFSLFPCFFRCKPKNDEMPGFRRERNGLIFPFAPAVSERARK